MAAKKLPGCVVLLMAFAVLALAIAVLRPVVAELRLVWQLRSPGDFEWKRAAEMLIEKGSRRGLVHATETALVRDPKGFGAWQKNLFELRPHDVHRALPAYEAGVRHEEAAVRRAAMQGLLNPGWRRPEAVPVAVVALESADPVIRWQAAYVLHEMGPGARAAVPALVQAAGDPEEHVRWAAVFALGVMAPFAPEGVPALAEALGDSSALVARQAASALGGLGRRGAPAVPALVAALRQGDVSLRARSAQTLRALGRTARDALPVILEALLQDGDWRYESSSYMTISDEYGEVLGDAPFVLNEWDPEQLDGRIDLIEAALGLGAKAGDVLPSLSKLIRDPGYGVRQRAAGALGRIGSAAEPAIPDLVRCLADKEPAGSWGNFDIFSDTNLAAAEALGAIGVAAVPALVEALGSSDPRTMYGAVWALGKMDGADRRAIEGLRSALTDARLGFAIIAARGLKRLDPGADVVAALLDPAARSPSERLAQLDGLDGLAGKEALPSLPLLRQALSKDGTITACVAARLLGSMAREAAEPLRDLLGALEAKDSWLRREAIGALGGLALRAEEVVHPLIRVLETDPDREVRLAAAGSLQKLGTKAEPALPALWRLHDAADKKEERSQWLAAITAISPCDPRVIEPRLQDPRGDWDTLAALDDIVKAGAMPRSLLHTVEPYLHHESIATRMKAARALWALDRRVEPVLAVAREALADDWSSGQWLPILLPFVPFPPGSEWRNPVREEAARLLSDMGSAGKPAVPELVACLDFPGHTVRVLAAEALRRVGGDTRLDVLIEALEDSIPNLAINRAWLEDFTTESLRVLGDLGPQAREAIPSLERLRAAARGPLREAVDEALRRIQ